MRWSIIRLIWLRDLRDQLRDRRTLFMIAGLPLLLYPVLGGVVLTFAVGFTQRPIVIGVVRTAGDSEDFPARKSAGAGLSPVPPLSWLSATGLPGNAGTALPAACALAEFSHDQLDYPLLIRDGAFVGPRLPDHARAERLRVVFLDSQEEALRWREDRKGDLVLSAPSDFFERIERGDEPAATDRATLTITGRKDDELSRQAVQRLRPLLDNWKELTRVRLAGRGLPETYDQPLVIPEPDLGAPPGGAQTIVDLMGRLIPFMLVMWSLAGALYPAVDLCAGEKERGTMETLLITPAGRDEIVLGKFLTIWVFSAGTALLNLLSMAVTTWYFSTKLPQVILPMGALAWCVLLSLPQAALFSAVSLAIGAYARSSKEGQYYLMPLFLLTMPLIFLTLAPGVELNAFYSLVPITGLALLMQQLIAASSLETVPWLYFIPVLGPMALYGWLALRWAIEQFHREEVLFREAERWDWKLWLRRLFREKEPLPNTGQALFCFAVILALRWVARGMTGDVPAEVHAGISAVAFVAAPALFMALMLNTMPREALYARRPRWRHVGLAVLLALVLLPPLLALTQAVDAWFPPSPDDPQPLVQLLGAPRSPAATVPGHMALDLLTFALLPAIGEELAFRGLILSGLHRHFRARNAILLSSFLFAIYHLNVFLFLPTFFLGIVLGLLTVRSRSLWPAVLFHFLYNGALPLVGELAERADVSALPQVWPWIIAASLVVAAWLVWQLYWKPYAELRRARRARGSS